MCAQNERTPKNGFKKTNGRNVPKKTQTQKLAKIQTRLALRGKKVTEKVHGKERTECAQIAKTMRNLTTIKTFF